MSIRNVDEAATMWCPKSGAPAGHPQGACVTNRCMWWRETPYNGKRDYLYRRSWQDESRRADGDTSEPPRPSNVPADAVWHPGSYDGQWYPGHWYESEARFRNRTLEADARFAAGKISGFCGVAGLPK